MKKYRVTEKHLGLKIECTIGEYDMVGEYYPITHKRQYIGYIPNSRFIQQLNDGWIEEIKEPEFTKSDMEEAFSAGRSLEHSKGNVTIAGKFYYNFNEWLNQRNETP